MLFFFLIFSSALFEGIFEETPPHQFLGNLRGNPSKIQGKCVKLDFSKFLMSLGNMGDIFEDGYCFGRKKSQ